MVVFMTDDELNSLADKLREKLTADTKAFWIEPQAHYDEHKSVSELVDDYKNAKNWFWKAFVGLAVIGGICLAAVGLGHYK